MGPLALQNMNPLFLAAEFPWTMELATSLASDPLRNENGLCLFIYEKTPNSQVSHL